MCVVKSFSFHVLRHVGQVPRLCNLPSKFSTTISLSHTHTEFEFLSWRNKICSINLEVLGCQLTTRLILVSVVLTRHCRHHIYTPFLLLCIRLPPVVFYVHVKIVSLKIQNKSNRVSWCTVRSVLIRWVSRFNPSTGRERLTPRSWWSSN